MDIIDPAQALALARRLHGDQVDLVGEDYVDGHLTRVQKAVELYHDPDMSVAAALHDSLEDTVATPAFLLVHGVSQPALTAIQIVTKQPGEMGRQGYELFVSRIATSGNLRAIRLKVEDVRDHLRPRSAPANRNPVRITSSLYQRYQSALLVLEQAARQLEVSGGSADDPSRS